MLPEIPYDEALSLQLDLRARVLAGEHPGGLLLLTHPSTVTIGRHGDSGNVTASPELLRRAGCAVHRIDRGGDVTWHGPGQLVGYPIVHLGRMKLGVRAWILRMASVITDVLSTWGVEATWDPTSPGLWIGREKLVAFGVHVHRQITTHGFAINVACDLSAFDLIVPCGLRDRGVTSLARQLGQACPTMADVAETVAAAFDERLGVNRIPEPPSKPHERCPQ